jgi:tellurite methyltransferase
MSAKDRARWDEIFKKRNLEPFPAPEPLLLQYVPLPEGDDSLRALDLAAGYGQNGLWLAEQGYHVDIMDISRVALRRARLEMGIRNLRSVNLLQVDLDKLSLVVDGDCEAANELCPESYDLIVVFRYLKRSIFPILKAALKVNGRIIYETFNTAYLEKVPEFNQHFLLEKNELLDAFSDWRLVYHDDSDFSTQLVAVKS